MSNETSDLFLVGQRLGATSVSSIPLRHGKPHRLDADGIIENRNGEACYHNSKGSYDLRKGIPLNVEFTRNNGDCWMICSSSDRAELWTMERLGLGNINPPDIPGGYYRPASQGGPFLEYYQQRDAERLADLRRAVAKEDAKLLNKPRYEPELKAKWPTHEKEKETIAALSEDSLRALLEQKGFSLGWITRHLRPLWNDARSLVEYKRLHEQFPLGLDEPDRHALTVQQKYR